MTVESRDITECIRQVVSSYGNLVVDIETLGDTDNLFHAGLNSHANVTVMLGLESLLGIEFPESMLRRSTFESIAAIRRSVGQLLLQQGTM